MTNQLIDLRPKIIDFPQTLTGLQIASQKSILWPCYAYKVSIPSRKKQNLNIFEETILKICAIEECDLERLSEITCLDVEIVRFIQCRLAQLNLLSDRFEITENARKQLDEWRNESEEFVAATLYIDLIAGNLLPVVTSGEMKLETVVSQNGDSVKFEMGSSGKKITIEAIKLRPNIKPLGMNGPSPVQVAKTIKIHQKLHKRYSMLNDSLAKLPVFYPKAEAITVQSEAELLYLHCQVIVQKGNPDFIVSDGFGYGFSSVFKDALDMSNAGWLINVKEKAIRETMVDKDPNIEDIKLPMFSVSIKQYPQIRNFLVLAEKNWKKSNEAFETSSQEQKFQNAIRDSLKYL